MRGSNTRLGLPGWCLLAALALTTSEAADTVYLFNGVDLSGWQPVNGHADNWSVADGILTWNGGEGARMIATKETYADFELELEFNYAPGCNSGVFFRTPIVKAGRPAFEGNEVQIVDEAFPKYQEKMTEDRRMGAIYSVAPPTAEVKAPPNAWHRMTIRCLGAHCRITLNDTVILDRDLTSFPAEKKKEHPGLTRPSGHICLQSKPDSKIKFRNIRLQTLTKGD